MSKRSDYVYNKFLDRWAERYFEIFQGSGQRAADKWLNEFIAEEDRTPVRRRIVARMGRR